jgi:hypothetical protein
MSFRVAKSLLTLRDQVNAMAPGRNTSSDGTIGDAAHRNRKSDHNPNEDGVVTAMDITHDPAHGVDAGELAEMLRASQDRRIKYVISNSRIFSSEKSPWQWRPYSGPNAHTKHVHISVLGEKALYDNTQPWPIEKVATITERPSLEAANDFTDIVATVFGGQSDQNFSAYDNHFITDSELGVALPFRFKGERPTVRVTNPANGKSVVARIVDVGPWNTNDPYWESGGRPQAESGIDRSGRTTNRAGIDLTPGTARAIGINGKGKVNWEFTDSTQVEMVAVPTVVPTTADPTLAELRARIDLLNKTIADQAAALEAARNIPRNAPGTELAVLLPQILAAVQSMNRTTNVPSAAAAEQIDQLRKVLEVVLQGSKPGPKPLGQVNGALGTTVGNLLNGKKTAIGVVGSTATAVLGNVPGGTGLGQVLAMLTPAAGLSGFAMPIFLAFTAWGVLGKLEKWAQGTAPPPKITS